MKIKKNLQTACVLQDYPFKTQQLYVHLPYKHPNFNPNCIYGFSEIPFLETQFQKKKKISISYDFPSLDLPTTFFFPTRIHLKQLENV